MRTIRPYQLALLGLLLAACGTETGGASTTPEPPVTTTVAPSTTTVAPSTTTLAPSTTTTALDSTTSSSSATSSTLAGSPIEFGPAEDDVLMVIGVAHDDVLNLRAGPGVGAGSLDGIPPTYDELVALGNTRELPQSFWIEVDYDRAEGWVNLSFVGYQGSVSDETAHVVATMGGYPTNSAMTGLAEEVAGVFAEGTAIRSSVVQVTPVSEGDLVEVTYDVIGLEDDSIRGVRLHIFAEEVTSGVRLRNVEATVICGRGVDGEVCV